MVKNFGGGKGKEPVDVSYSRLVNLCRASSSEWLILVQASALCPVGAMVQDRVAVLWKLSVFILGVTNEGEKKVESRVARIASL